MCVTFEDEALGPKEVYRASLLWKRKTRLGFRVDTEVNKVGGKADFSLFAENDVTRLSSS